MSQKKQGHFLWYAFSVFILKFLVIAVVFVLSPYLVFLTVKSNHASLSPAIIKVQKTGRKQPVPWVEYRIHPSWAEKSRILQFINSIIKKYGTPNL